MKQLILLLGSILILIPSLLLNFSTYKMEEVPHWSEPQNLGKIVNSPYNERFPMLAANGLSLYFASDRPGGLAAEGVAGAEALDIYVSRRTHIDAPWTEPVHLGPPVSTRYADHSVAFSPDGHWMYFASTRPGSCGKHDLYLTHREDPNDDAGWGEPKNLGCLVNSAADDSCPFFYEDEESGDTWLYFVSTRKGGPGSWDVYASLLNGETGVFGEPVLVENINSPSFDGHFDVREGILWSGNVAGMGGSDLWYTRKDDNGKWLQPVNFGPPVNTIHNDGCFTLSHDGSELVFISDRPGGSGGTDIFTSQKITGPD